MNDKELVALMAAIIHGACLASPSEKPMDAILHESAQAAFELYQAVETVLAESGRLRITS